MPRSQVGDSQFFEHVDAAIGNAERSRGTHPTQPRAIDERGEQPCPEQAANVRTPLGPIETSSRKRPSWRPVESDVDAMARQPRRRIRAKAVLSSPGWNEDAVALERGGKLDSDRAGEMVVAGPSDT